MYLLFDIGGTNMRVAVSKDGKSLGEIKVVPTPQDFETGIQSIKQIADELLNGERITKIAGGIAGPLDKEKSMLVASPHIRGWVNESTRDLTVGVSSLDRTSSATGKPTTLQSGFYRDKPLKQAIIDAFGVEVLLENDSTLAALGEAVFGAGKDYSIVGYVGIGTGVGGAKIVNGEVDQNSSGFEIGHQIIEVNGKPCHCGGKGHLESYVAGGYFQENYGVDANNLTDQNKEEISKYLAAGLNNIAVHWSPEVIILGGSVMNSLSIETIQKYFDEALTIFPQKIKLLKAELLDKAGLYGSLTQLS